MDSYKITLLVGLLVYFAIMLYFSRRQSSGEKSVDEYFLANRSLPAWVMALTCTASWFGGAAAIVSVDKAYTNGLSALGIIALPTVVSLIILIFLAGRIRRLAIVSQPEIAEKRYNKTARIILSIVVAWYMLTWASSQMVAAGQFFSGFFNISYVAGLLICVGVVYIYALFGGFRAVVMTDVIQFLLLAVGCVLLLFIVLGKGGGFSGMTATIAKRGDSKSFFNFFTGFRYTSFYVLSFVFAWIIEGDIWQRISAVKSEKEATKSMKIALAVCIPLFIIMVVIGMASTSLFPEIPEGGVIPALITNYLHPAIGLIVFIGIMAAVMSTMDTGINTGALIFTEDIYHRLINPKANQKKLANVGMIATTIVVIIAIMVAVAMRDIIWALWMASDILAAGAFWPLVLGLYWRKGTTAAAISSMIAGCTFVAYDYAVDLGAPFVKFWPGWPFSVAIGIVIGLIVYVGVSLIWPAKEEEKKRIEEFFAEAEKVEA